MCQTSKNFEHARKSHGDLPTYDEWVDNAIKVGQGIEQLQSQKIEIERRIGILQVMAKQLIDEGVDTYYRQKTFPLGRNHFNRFMYRLIKIVKEKRAIEQLKEVP